MTPDQQEFLDAAERKSIQHARRVARYAMAATVFVLGVLACFFVGCPRYSVYSAQMDGLAKLREADGSRQIAVLEAKAKREAAAELAQAEIERARGVAQANKIIGDSLQGNEDYLRYLWIQSLENGKNEVIYVPTEANLPILEASRKQKPPGVVGEPKP